MIIWSSTENSDYLLDMSPDELRSELISSGCDADMITELSDVELYDFVKEDYRVASDNPDNILRDIAASTRNGIAVLEVVHQGLSPEYSAIDLNMLADGVSNDMYIDTSDYAIISDDATDEVYIESNGFNINLYAVPINDEACAEFIFNCMPEYVEEYSDEVSVNSAYELLLDRDITDEDIITYIDTEAVAPYCRPIKFTGGIFLSESLHANRKLKEDFDMAEPEAVDNNILNDVSSTSLISDLVSNEWSSINLYNDIIASFDSAGELAGVNILIEMRKDSYRHIAALEDLLADINPDASILK